MLGYLMGFLCEYVIMSGHASLWLELVGFLSAGPSGGRIGLISLRRLCIGISLFRFGMAFVRIGKVLQVLGWSLFNRNFPAVYILLCVAS